MTGRIEVRSLVAIVLLLAAGSCAQPETVEKSPNILLIVVDTLRADHLGAYGYPRQTSPQIDALLAERGTVIEHAYAQAPWTLPSVASMLTGLRPELLLDADGLPWGIPEQAPTLAERLAAAGYDTAAFVANPTVHQGNGFAAGFDHFWSPPYEVESLHRHAEDVNVRAEAWLQQRHQRADERPFFAYVHYLDPHDPYDNSDLVDGRSEFFPDYQGKVRGGDVHGLYLGVLELTDPATDIEHLTALYDSEIKYVDRHIGALIESLGEVVDDTLILLTSDHGEELFDHGGWKHGETLYQEQIRVPLIVRWDGHIPAGRRLPGVARLLDLQPTLLAAAGVSQTGSQGRSLLPALTSDGSADAPASRDTLSEKGAAAQHLAGGPLRAAHVAADRKVVLFDRHAPMPDGLDDRQRVLWLRDRERMQRLEVYDLSRDPDEEQSDAGGEPVDMVGVLSTVDSSLSGLRWMALGLPADGSLLEAELVLDKVPDWRPLFLAEDDEVEVDGQVIRVRWRADQVPKGLLFTGAIGRLRSATATLNGLPWPVHRPSTRSDPSKQVIDQPIEARDLVVDDYPWRTDARGMHLWLRVAETPYGDGERDAETIRRLRALGYL